MINKTILFLLSGLIMSFSSSFSQSTPATFDTEYDTAQREFLAPYETTISLVRHTEFYRNRDNDKQYITLEAGQELVVYVENPYHASNGDIPHLTTVKCFEKWGDFCNYSNNSTSCGFFTLNWDGWNNFFDNIPPLKEEQSLNTNGNPLGYHFKAIHSGVIRLVFTHNSFFLPPASRILEVTVN